MPSLFPQNVIAVIWDFDKTLIPGYMQEPLFAHYGVDPTTFWDEANGLKEVYLQQGLKMVSADTLYLNHMLTYVNEGVFEGLNNQTLRSFGQQVKFCDGLPGFFPSLKRLVETNERYARHEIAVEHYIVSTGLREIIMGSQVAEHVESVWACEFVEHVALPGYLTTPHQGALDTEPVIRQTGYVIDNTAKTRAIFEINKGSNKFPSIDVNAFIPEDERRVPFENMIYVADGPSDVPVFSLVKRYGGKTFAVYEAESQKSFDQAHDLLESGRVHGVGPADYRSRSQAEMWLTRAVVQIADRLIEAKEGTVARRVKKPPQHILENPPRTEKSLAPYAIPKAQVPKLVDDLLARAGITSAPVRLEPVLRELGIELSEDANQSEDAIVVPMTDPELGVPEAWTVFYNPNRPERRRRFTIAHEIGHVVLHGSPHGAASARGGGGVKSRERQADGFAAELLMPPTFVRAAILELGEGVEMLAERFDVSVEAMQRRLIELGIAKATATTTSEPGRRETRGSQPPK